MGLTEDIEVVSGFKRAGSGYRGGGRGESPGELVVVFVFPYYAISPRCHESALRDRDGWIRVISSGCAMGFSAEMDFLCYLAIFG